MGKYDKEVKKIYNTYKPETVTSHDEFLKNNKNVFSNLVSVIKEYRSRYIPKSKVIQYLDEIENAGDYKKVIDDIRNNILEETISVETILAKLYDSANIILTMVSFISEKIHKKYLKIYIHYI